MLTVICLDCYLFWIAMNDLLQIPMPPVQLWFDDIRSCTYIYLPFVLAEYDLMHYSVTTSCLSHCLVLYHNIMEKMYLKILDCYCQMHILIEYSKNFCNLTSLHPLANSPTKLYSSVARSTPHQQINSFAPCSCQCCW